MRYRLRTLLTVVAIVPPLIAGEWMMPGGGWASNCGGNNAARNYLLCYAMSLQQFAEDNPTHEFSLATATLAQRIELVGLPGGRGIGESDILISTKTLRLDDSTSRKNIIAACSRPFTNVPQYFFHEAPPTHAVVYSDGSTALLSTRQFAALDRSAFVRVSEIDTSSP